MLQRYNFFLRLPNISAIIFEIFFIYDTKGSGTFVSYSLVSLIVVFMVILFDDFDILVESEDRAGQQERLRHVVEQP